MHPVPEKIRPPYKIRNDLINSPLHPNQYRIAPIDLTPIKKVATSRTTFIIVCSDGAKNQTPNMIMVDLWGYNKGESRTSIRTISVLWQRASYVSLIYQYIKFRVIRVLPAWGMPFMFALFYSLRVRLVFMTERWCIIEVRERCIVVGLKF